MIVFDPLLRSNLTGTESTTWPPPVLGWSTETLDPPFALVDDFVECQDSVWIKAGTNLIVVFLHAISAFDQSDLDLLLRFQQSLDEVAEPRESTQRIRNACAVFSSVAQAYVGTRSAPTTELPGQEAMVVRRENLQEAFDTSQNTNFEVPVEPAAGWYGSANVNVDEL